MKDLLSPLKLGFDPELIGGDTAKVFEDDIARTLYLAIRPGSIIGPEFDGLCLEAADTLRKQGIPDTAAKFKQVFLRLFGDTYNKDLPERMLPYLKGKKTIEYSVIVKENLCLNY